MLKNSLDSRPLCTSIWHEGKIWMAILMKDTKKISHCTHLFNVEDTTTNEDL